jgi:hypothetical protein
MYDIFEKQVRIYGSKPDFTHTRLQQTIFQNIMAGFHTMIFQWQQNFENQKQVVAKDF